MKKFLPYILIFLILVGLFGPTVNVQAAGNCIVTPLSGDPYTQPVENKEACDRIKIENPAIASVQFVETTANTQVGPCYVNGVQLGPTYTGAECASKGGIPTPPTPPTKDNLLYNSVKDSCGIIMQGTLGGCLVYGAYWLVYVLPSNILYYTAYLFNAMLSLTLGTILYAGSFLGEAWKIVRDFSNIFFILILLYIAIKMILGLGGAEIKKMIAQVIVVALLINFSMFFTQVVIDSSNILALIFYNKITLNTTKNGQPRDYGAVFDQSKTGIEEKDFAGGIMEAFDPTKLISEDTFRDKKNSEATYMSKFASVYSNNPKTAAVATGLTLGVATVPIAIYAWLAGDPVDIAFFLSIIFVAGAVFLFAAYAFFIAALAFIGRLIELWMLIIFSPFAFMSLSVPNLKSVEFLGWDSWLKRLLSTAFMAPIFMFALYLISKLVKINIFADLHNKDQRSAGQIMLVIIPAIIYVTLLYKATQFAKKHSGEFGEMVIKYGGVAAAAVGGLALTAASGGATMAIGGALGGKLSAAKGTGVAGKASRALGGFLQDRKFDFRNIKTFGIGDRMSKAGLGKGREESFKGIKEKQKEKHDKRVAELEKRGTVGEKREVEEAKANLGTATAKLKTGPESIVVENAKQALKAAELPVKAELEHLDVLIGKFERDLGTAIKAGDSVGESRAKTLLKTAKKDKEDIRATQGLQTLEGDVRKAQTAYNEIETRDLLPLEEALVNAQRNYDIKLNKVIEDYADKISRGTNKAWNLLKNQGLYSKAQAGASARTIRQRAKTDSEPMNNPPLMR